jgi:hypothetical protein
MMDSIVSIVSDEPSVNSLIIAIIVILFFTLHIVLRPFNNKNDNKIEEISLFSLIIIILLRGYLSYDLTQVWILYLILFLGTFVSFVLFLRVIYKNAFFNFLRQRFIRWLRTPKKDFSFSDLPEVEE